MKKNNLFSKNTFYITILLLMFYTIGIAQVATVRYQGYVQGGATMFGNSWYEKDPTNNPINDQHRGQVVDVDTDSNTKISTYSDLILPAGSEIIKAYLHIEKSMDFKKPSPFQSVKIKIPGGNSYITLTTNSPEYITARQDTPTNRFLPYAHQAIFDITNLIPKNGFVSTAGGGGAGRYYVADPTPIQPPTDGYNVVPATNLGGMGGWSITVLYKNNASKIRHITLYDNWQFNWNTTSSINVPNVKIPPSGTINAIIGATATGADYTDESITLQQNYLRIKAVEQNTPLTNIANPYNGISTLALLSAIAWAPNNNVSTDGGPAISGGISTRAPVSQGSLFAQNSNSYYYGLFIYDASGIIKPSSTPVTLEVEQESVKDQMWSGAFFLSVDAEVPVLSKALSPTTINNGGIATYTFTIDNTSSTALDQTDITFTDNLPSGIVIASSPNITQTCNGATVTATAGSGTISVSNLSIAAGATCTITVDVTNATGQTNANCTANPDAFTNSSKNISNLTNLANGVFPQCLIVNTQAAATIDAVNGSQTVKAGTTGTVSVLANDKRNNAALSLSDVTLTQSSTTDKGVTLDTSTGMIKVAAGTAAGDYTVTYKICDKTETATCDTATEKVTVPISITVDAVDGSQVVKPGTTGTTSVLANDKYNDGTESSATLTNVNLTQKSTSNTGVTLNTSTGMIQVAAGTAPGNYTVEYEICAKSATNVCNTAIETVYVFADSDGDGIADNADIDDDNDGIIDDIETCSTVTITASDLGITSSGNGLSGNNKDISSKFSLPAGSIVVDYSNLNFNGTSFIVSNDASGNLAMAETTFNVTSSVPVKIGISHGRVITTDGEADYFKILSGQTFSPKFAPNTGFSIIQNGNTPGYDANVYGLLKNSGGAIGTPASGITFETNYFVNNLQFIAGTSDYGGGGGAIWFGICIPKDTDGDSILDYLDLDSDNDGCLDAIEGGADIKLSQLVNSAGNVSVGTGSTASNQNLCASGSCVNTEGLPQFTTVPTNYSNSTGQTADISQNASISTNACKCFKPAATGGTVIPTKHGITTLGRVGNDGDGNTANDWPTVRKGAWTALEAKSKGFVINRIPTTAQVNAIPNPVEGMMVYDEQADCLKIYTKDDAPATTSSWRCFNTQTCPDVL